MKSPLPVRPAHISAAALLLSAPLMAFGQASLEEQGKKFVDDTCNTCHKIGARTGSGYTPEGWDTVLRMMTNHGVPIPADQMPAAKAYLVKTYPVTGRPAAKIVDGPMKVSMKSWSASTPGARPHDPLAARDGSFWYTGQMNNALGRVDPKTGKV